MPLGSSCVWLSCALLLLGSCLPFPLRDPRGTQANKQVFVARGMQGTHKTEMQGKLKKEVASNPQQGTKRTACMEPELIATKVVFIKA
jgi:hypothetical protein